MVRRGKEDVRIISQGVGRSLGLVNVRIRHGRTISANDARRIYSRFNPSEGAQFVFSVLAYPARVEGGYSCEIY